MKITVRFGPSFLTIQAISNGVRYLVEPHPMLFVVQLVPGAAVCRPKTRIRRARAPTARTTCLLGAKYLQDD